MSFRILCTGDIHIGRRSSKTSDTYRCADIWLATVDLAIAESVDLVAISGDVIDKESKSYEALGPLMTGLDRLAQAGIETVAVSGNHDHDVLFRVMEVTGTDRLRVLGRSGHWERCTIRNPEGMELCIHGWSFPREHVPTSPISTFPASDGEGRPTLALVHGEIGVPLSRYAPISLSDLWARQVDFWLLGHIHAPAHYTGPSGAIALYPGSPLAMDPGEPGVHGVWIAEFKPGHPVILTQRSISPVHYIQTEIDASWVTDETDFMTALTMGLKEIGVDVQRTHKPGSLREIICRVRLVGRNRHFRLIEGWMDQAQLDLGPIQISPGTAIRIDRIESQVRPAINLEETARSNDLAGETARLILAIDQSAETPAQAAFLKDVAAHAVRVHQHASYTPLTLLDDAEPVAGAAPDLRQLVREQAWQVLAHLVAQKEPA